jgi:hypothetical protein
MTLYGVGVDNPGVGLSVWVCVPVCVGVGLTSGVGVAVGGRVAVGVASPAPV